MIEPRVVQTTAKTPGASSFKSNRLYVRKISPEPFTCLGDICSRQFMAGIHITRLDIGAARFQRIRYHRRAASHCVVTPIQHQDIRSREIGGRRIVQRLNAPQQNSAAHDTGMKLHHRRQKVGAVGIAEEGKPARVVRITGHSAFNEGCERFGFAANISLIERRRIKAAEPAIGPFLGRRAIGIKSASFPPVPCSSTNVVPSGLSGRLNR